MIEQSSQMLGQDLSDSSNSKQKNKSHTFHQVLINSNNNSNNIESSQNQNHSAQIKNILPLCINKICPKVKNSISKSHQNKTYAFDPNLLCKQCMIQYKKQAYCLYCKQIYFDSSDDGKQWILCDQCGRWVHCQCANYDPHFDSEFKCIKCKKVQVGQNQPSLLKKQSFKPNPKIGDRRKQLAQCSLNAYGFFWQLGPKQLAEDMDKIRQYLN